MATTQATKPRTLTLSMLTKPQLGALGLIFDPALRLTDDGPFGGYHQVRVTAHLDHGMVEVEVCS